MIVCGGLIVLSLAAPSLIGLKATCLLISATITTVAGVDYFVVDSKKND